MWRQVTGIRIPRTRTMAIPTRTAIRTRIMGTTAIPTVTDTLVHTGVGVIGMTMAITAGGEATAMSGANTIADSALMISLLHSIERTLPFGVMPAPFSCVSPHS